MIQQNDVTFNNYCSYQVIAWITVVYFFEEIPQTLIIWQYSFDTNRFWIDLDLVHFLESDQTSCLFFLFVCFVAFFLEETKTFQHPIDMRIKIKKYCIFITKPLLKDIFSNDLILLIIGFQTSTVTYYTLIYLD